MSAPISGPIVKVRSALGGPNYYGYRPEVFFQRRETFRQRQPYNLVLPYRVDTVRVLSHSSSDPVDYTSTSMSDSFTNGPAARAGNIAYQRLLDQIGDRSQLATLLAERREAAGMVAKRATDLFRVVRQVKRGNIPGALSALKLSFTKGATTKVGAAKTVADFWLETWFGWLPTISDIGNAVEILQNPLPSRKIRGKGFSEKIIRSSYSRTNYPMNGYYVSQGSAVEQAWVWSGCRVKVIDPNLYYANAMGFVNPALVAWELIPFSFVVDWFANVGDVISSYTDFVGLEVTEAFQSSKQFLTVSHSTNGLYRSIDTNTGATLTQTTHYSGSKRAEIFQRSGSLVVPQLKFTLPGKVSPTRAATAISLLMQGLR